MQEVCKICFNRSSHKISPSLIPFHKSLVDSDGNRSCPACKQQWLTETVAKDRENSRKWVAVRPPPKIDPLMDYRLCTSTRKKQPPCRNGPKCTFAHNTVELQEWNRKRGSFKKSHHPHQTQIARGTKQFFSNSSIMQASPLCSVCQSWLYNVQISAVTAPMLPW